MPGEGNREGPPRGHGAIRNNLKNLLPEGKTNLNVKKGEVQVADKDPEKNKLTFTFKGKVEEKSSA